MNTNTEDFNRRSLLKGAALAGGLSATGAHLIGAPARESVPQISNSIILSGDSQNRWENDSEKYMVTSVMAFEHLKEFRMRRPLAVARDSPRLRSPLRSHLPPAGRDTDFALAPANRSAGLGNTWPARDEVSELPLPRP